MHGAGLDGRRGDMPGRRTGPADCAATEVSNLLLAGRRTGSRGLETAGRDGARGGIRRSGVVRHAARRDPGRPEGGAARSQPILRREALFAGRRSATTRRRPGRGYWVRTKTGVSHIELRTMTLAAKAALFEERVHARHDRHGLVSPSNL